MYTAVLVGVMKFSEVPDNILNFVHFDAKRRGIEHKPDDLIAILQVKTSMSFIPIPLGIGLTLGDVEKELSEVQVTLDPQARSVLGSNLK